MSLAAFLDRKRHIGGQHGFQATYLPDWLFDFQKAIVEWATLKGRAAIFADCGLGKTPMQLVWAQNVVERTNRAVLILSPLACSRQTVMEAEKFHIDARRYSTSSTARIVVANYERLSLFDPNDFIGLVCDESSILKSFDGSTKNAVTDFARRMPYRLLCTATAAPNDYIELGTSAEALGEMGYMDMLSMFFKNEESSIEPMSYKTKWRFKPHAEQAFWRWMCSWARALRAPSDLGYADGGFVLPPLTTRVQIVNASRPLNGRLFIVPAETLEDQREERRATIQERCAFVQALAAEDATPFIAWCHLNAESDLLEQMIPEAKQVSGSQSDEEKEELFEAFTAGQLRCLVTKPKIGGFGMNWQHCARMSMFPSHSYEQYYQSIRRCWRFGQQREVTVDVVSTAGEADVLGNLQRKAVAADAMFVQLVAHMRAAQTIEKRADYSVDAPLPDWMPA